MEIPSQIKKRLPFVILGGFTLLAFLVSMNPPAPALSKPESPYRLAVEAITIEPRNYPVKVQSYGNVRPRTQSFLVSQVSGQITWVSPNFRAGGFFDQGELLVQIDPLDYEANVRTAESNLIDAQQALVQEQARVEQAKVDWKKLGNEDDIPALVRREPQLKAAQAKVLASQAALDIARANLKRTRIIAPYGGRILNKSVDLGQVVSANATLAELYATDTVEIRLPLKRRDLAYIDLPESDSSAQGGTALLPDVDFISELMAEEVWRGRVVRTEGAIDTASQQLYVVAQIDDPYGAAAQGKRPLKIGQYVTAEIKGRVQQGALVIPVSSIYQGTYVYLANGGTVQRRPVDIAWQNGRDAIIKSGLQAGDKLVVTPLGQVASGTAVQLIEQQP